MPTPSITPEAASLFSAFNPDGTPDLALVKRERAAGRGPAILTGEYRISEFVEAGYCLYGMIHPLKPAGYRKLGNHTLPFLIEDDIITFDTYYVLNQSDTDPYLARVECRATIDHITFTYGRGGLLLARYERGFVKNTMDDCFVERWTAAMEMRIAERHPSVANAVRYPYALYRTMQVIRRNIESREWLFDRSLPLTQQLPSDDELAGLDKMIVTPEALGQVFYTLLGRKPLTLEELAELVDRVVQIYQDAIQ